MKVKLGCGEERVDVAYGDVLSARYAGGVLRVRLRGREATVLGWRARALGRLVGAAILTTLLSCAALVTAPCWGTGALLLRRAATSGDAR